MSTSLMFFHSFFLGGGTFPLNTISILNKQFKERERERQISHPKDKNKINKKASNPLL